MTPSQIEYWKMGETKRSNLSNEKLTAARDAETKRHNLEVERQGALNLDLLRVAAAETNRSNVAREIELNRSNVARETTQKYEADIKASALAEQIEQNKRQNLMNMLNLSELTRHNQTNEEIAYLQATEANRHNIAQEQEQKRSNKASLEQKQKIDAENLAQRKFEFLYPSQGTQLDQNKFDFYRQNYNKEFWRDTAVGGVKAASSAVSSAAVALPLIIP